MIEKTYNKNNYALDEGVHAYNHIYDTDREYMNRIRNYYNPGT